MLTSASRRRIQVALTVFVLAAASIGLEAGEARVVLVSIDGLAAFHLDNEALEIPNLRELERLGVRTESSETVFPSVTHPSHTTIMTGVMPRVHGVIGNRLRNRETGERFHITNKPRTETVRVPTIFDAAKARGLGTASFYWPENKDDPSLDRCIPEVFDENSKADPAAADPDYLEELRAANVPIDLFYETYGERALNMAGDVALAKAAAYEIRTRQPHLLAIHFVSTDSTQHAYGSGHELSRSALTVADACVGLLRKAVEDAGLAEDTTFIIGADHGFHTVQHAVNVHPVFRDSGLLDRVALRAKDWILYVETLEGFDPDRDGPLLETTLEKVLDVPGVARVVRPEEFHELGYPRYEEDPHVAGQFMLVGDIDTFLVADPESDTTERYRLPEARHGHGYLPQHPRMYPGLILSGRRIRQGGRIGHVHNLDIAPTIVSLLGLEMEGLEGRVLEEALIP